MDLVSNHQLFSAVYLRELQKGKHAADVLDGARQTIREWREEYSALSDASNRSAYVRQCLSALGVSMSPHEDGYVLYADATKAEPTGLCLVTDEFDLGRTVKGSHPQARLVRELRKASFQWGMLTNGVRWRLCFADASAPYEVYIEAELDEILKAHTLQDFSLFYRFFGSEAFSISSGLLGLTRFLSESDKRTEAVERHLKGQVEAVLQKLCLGFVQDEAAGSYDAGTLQVIYQNAIYLLYRILFLFYAEARELLPIGSDAYKPVSLAGLVETAYQLQMGATDDDSFSLWKRLTRLFVIVDDGDEELSIAAYNGGLFSDSEKPYLKNHKIRNEYLVPALFALGFEETKRGYQPIDYRDLSVRHLGTLYEGLLEYRLNLVKNEPIVVRESGGKRVFLPMSMAQPVKRGELMLEVGQVYFADDKGERKASGSYYTPEDVVQYIVSNTVTPKLEEHRQAFDVVREEVEQERAVAPTPEHRQQLELYSDQKALDTIEKGILRLCILDPAMGSGHFLVAATQSITDFIIETLNATDWLNENISTDPLIWKRRVVERCIYGVDKNPLAYELAKLSLWITSASASKPLTFLDHHLKTGNSLYGTPLSLLANLPTSRRKEPTKSKDVGLLRILREQAIQSALQELAGITQIDSDTIEAVKHKDEVNHKVRTLTENLRSISNLWLSTLFGLKTVEGGSISEEVYERLLNDITSDDEDEESHNRFQTNPYIQEANYIAKKEGFFHWELEFPDAVANGECRFDVVIENPPYVGTKANAAINALYETAKCGDLYAWLFEKALRMTGDDGNVGTIIPLSLMFAGEKQSLRKLLLSKNADIWLMSTDNNPDAIFEAPGSPRNRQRTTIVTLKGTGNEVRILTTDYLRWLRSERSILFKNIRYADTTTLASEIYIPSIGNDKLVQFLEHLRSCKHTLANYTEKEGQAYLCVQSAACYFISAVPVDLHRRNQEMFYFENEIIRNLIFSIINSNVFYWYWRSRSDGFWVSREQILSMPLPDLQIDNEELLRLAERLWKDSGDYAVEQNINGKQITSYYFNKRMDILLDIDAWIVQHVAPELNLARDTFAQYKSNSFLRPLDLSALGKEEGEEMRAEK